VRPHIPLSQRINDAAEILILKAGEEILAATCMQWLKDIPEDEQDLIELDKDKNVAVFYKDNIMHIVTLSPQTEMARRFHLKNGASVHRENPTSVNYKYYSKQDKPL